MSIEDKELDEMFHGEEKPLHPDTVHITYSKPDKITQKDVEDSIARSYEEAYGHKKTAQKDPHTPTHDFKDGKWNPKKPEPNWMDKLKESCKWGLLFGVLSCLVFYWKEAGLMAESIAVPTIAICTALAGFGVGKNATGGNK